MIAKRKIFGSERCESEDQNDQQIDFENDFENQKVKNEDFEELEQEDRRRTRATDGGASSSAREGLRISKWSKTLCTDIKLIDFGGATYKDDHHTTIINTR